MIKWGFWEWKDLKKQNKKTLNRKELKQIFVLFKNIYKVDMLKKKYYLKKLYYFISFVHRCLYINLYTCLIFKYKNINW